MKRNAIDDDGFPAGACVCVCVCVCCIHLAIDHVAMVTDCPYYGELTERDPVGCNDW